MLYTITCDFGVSLSSRRKNWRKTMNRILTFIENKYSWVFSRIEDFIWHYPCLSFVIVIVLATVALVYVQS